MLEEPTSSNWTLAIAGSFLLHALAAGTLMHLMSSDGSRPPQTEISFADSSVEAVAPAASARAAALPGGASSESLAPAAPEAALREKGDAAQLLTEADRQPTSALPAVAGQAPPVPAQPAHARAERLQPDGHADLLKDGAPVTVAAATSAAVLTPTPDGAAADLSAVGQSALTLPAAHAAVIASGQSAASASTLRDAGTSDPAAPAATAASALSPAPSAPLQAMTAATLSGQEPAVPRADPDARSEDAAPEAIASSLSTIARTDSDRLVPVATSTSDALTPASSVGDAAAETLKGASEREDVAQLFPNKTEAASGATRPATPWQEAVAFTRNFNGGGCFAAIPVAGRGSGIAFQLFGENRAEMRDFASGAVALPAAGAVSFNDLSRAQCRALLFARNASAYPGFSLTITVDSPRFLDGARVSGRIGGRDGKAVRLVLIDDEGKVQPLGTIQADDPDPTFRFPATLTHGRVATEQMLMAIAADPPLDALSDAAPRQAEEFFSRLEGEAAAQGSRLDIALQGFNVDAEGTGDN